ncbi:MAG: response regulator [Selenomonadaceae bacterium]|nr:response regulator [Selenomonadaceae bacterium]
MEKNAILIRSGASFMVNAIQKNLEEAGFKILPVDATVAAVNEKHTEAGIFVFYLGEFVSKASDLLVYLKDLCAEEEKLLVLLGTSEEIAIVEKTIPSMLVAAKFERPLDIKTLIDEMNFLAQASDASARRKNILLVDDDDTFLKTIKSWLSSTYRVTIVTSGAQALMYIADNKPDLILLDYEMPVTSGPQVLEMIRSETKTDKIPVIFLTGKGDRESVMKVLELKPDGYLLKSTSKEALLKSLEEFFEKKKYEQLHEMPK